MIFLYILLGVLALIAAVLFIPIGVSLTANDDYKVCIHYLGLRFNVFPERKKNKSKKKKAKKRNKKHKRKQKAESEKSSNQVFIKQLFEKYGASGGVGRIVSILKTLCEKSLYLTRHLVVKKLNASITVASDDAAKTAIEYGAVNAVVYPFLAFLDNNLIIKQKNVNINCDFNSTKTILSAYVLISIKPLYMLITGAGALIKLVAVKGEKNERKQ